MVAEGFWRHKRLDELDAEEWEALCDGCGQCCRVKLEDEDSGIVAITDVVCALLDPISCRCVDYANRRARVRDCIGMDVASVAALTWLPSTCAYRLRSEGRELPRWHYLVCGDRDRVHSFGKSVRGKVACETEVDEAEYESRIVRWIEPK